MSVFLNEPSERAPVTFATEGPDSLGAFGGLPQVWLARQYIGLGSDLLDDDRRAAMGALFSSSDEMQHFVDNTFAREDAAIEAYRRRIERIHEATGVQLDNPMVAVKSAEVSAYGKFTDPLGGVENLRDIANGQVRDFKERLADLKAEHPEHAALFDQNFTSEIGGLVQDADGRRKAAETGAEDLTGLSAIGAGFAGAARGMLRDPLQVATLFAGAPASVAKSVAGRIGQTVLQEAAINAGVETLVQTRAQAWRAENGLESGLLPGLKQVGLAALFGGGFGGLLAGGRETARALNLTDAADVSAAERLAAGDAGAGDLQRIADRLGVPIDQLDARTLELARAQGRLDDAAFDNLPEGISPDEAALLQRDAIGAIEEERLPTFAPVQKPKRNVEENPVLLEATDAPDEISLRFGRAGPRPITKASFDPDTIGTDAAAYQYKGGGDEAGVTTRLREVKRWDPTASGKVMVHERENGERYVADGHQRLGLAQRLQERGEPGVKLDGFLFRERDGWTAEDVRALAAKKNLQEGSGEAIDAARILRDRPDILDDGLPTTGPMMKKAVSLARLSDDAWSLTVNGLVDENHAALVGQVIADPTTHAAAVRELARFQPESDRAARSLLDEIVASGVRQETQVDMFGAFDLSRTLIPERVRVLDETIKVLRRDRRLFALLGQRADVIEAAGNVLDASGNATRAVTAETVGAVIERMARTRGPVSDALTDSARRVATEKASVTAEARIFINAIQTAVERDGMRVLLSPPEPQLAPGRVVEPASREATELAGDLPEIRSERSIPSRVPDVEPIGDGPFGPIFPKEPFTGNWIGAVDLLASRQDGEIPGLLHHPEVGPIDVIWGKYDSARPNAGEGLAKIVQKHPEVVDNLPNILAGMTVETRSTNRIRLRSASHRAVVRLDYDGERKSWLVTAYEENRRGGETTDRPTGRQEDGHSSSSSPDGDTIAEIEAAGQTSLWDALPDGSDVDGRPLHVTGEDLLARAERDGFLSDTLRFCEV